MRKNKIIMSIFCMMLLYNFVLFNDVAKADSIYSLDYGWEDKYPSGQNNGSIGLIDFEGVETGLFQISSVWENNGSKSFYVESNDVVVGYWNLTTSFSFINHIEWYGKWVEDNSDEDLYMRFYDDDDNELINLVFDGIGVLYYYGITLGKTALSTCSANGVAEYSDGYKIEIDYNDTNMMIFKIFNETGVLKVTKDMELASSVNWESFSYVKFVTGAIGANSVDCWFDDFSITSSGSQSGWESCQGGTFLVTKMFRDSIGYFNDTLTFEIQKNLMATGYYAIYNSTGDSPVQSGSFNSQTYPTWYFVDHQYRDGTYYIKVGYEFGTWLISCPFTIITSTAVVSDWSVRFDRASYSKGDFVSLFYKIPVGETGNVTITLIDNEGNEYSYKTYNLLSGTGTEVKMSNLFSIPDSWGGDCLNAWLRNSTNNELMGDNCHYVACIPKDIDYWILYIDNGFTAEINYGDSVYIHGDHNYPNAWIRFMNDTDPVNGTILSQINIGVDVFGFDYDKFSNTTIGVERFYVYLYADGEYLDDGIYRYVDVYDADTLDPLTDSGWYGLPVFVKYLIGVFLTLFVTMSPLIIGSYITRKTRIDRIDIPSLLYVGFFFFGLIISVVLDFLPSWLPFVILFGMITFFAVQWLYGNKASISGE